jgi:hypothetical protein
MHRHFRAAYRSRWIGSATAGPRKMRRRQLVSTSRMDMAAPFGALALATDRMVYGPGSGLNPAHRADSPPLRVGKMGARRRGRDFEWRAGPPSTCGNWPTNSRRRSRSTCTCGTSGAVPGPGRQRARPGLPPPPGGVAGAHRGGNRPFRLRHCRRGSAQAPSVWRTGAGWPRRIHGRRPRPGEAPRAPPEPVGQGGRGCVTARGGPFSTGPPPAGPRV